MSFVTDEFVKKILRQENPESDVKILDKTLENKIPEFGYNFASQVSRLIVNYESDGKKYSKYFVIKIPNAVPLYTRLKEKGVYEQEIKVYENVLKALGNCLPDENITPKYYGTDGKDALVMEDLSQSGYSTKNRREFLDFQHSAIAFKTLATFHALSIQLRQTKPEIFDNIRQNLFLNPDQSDRQLKSQYEEAFTKIINRTNPEHAKAHTDALSYVKSQLVRSAIDDLQPKDDSFNVLNHGEFWNDNILFKYDKYGRVCDAKLIDFQLCRWSSPALDIIHFAATSLKFDVFEKYFDLLLEIYVDTLNSILTYLKIDRSLKLSDLKNDIVSKYNYWILLLISIAPAYLADGRFFFDEKLLDEERYVKHSAAWFTYFINKGVFSKYDDTVNAVNAFLKTFQSQNNVVVTKYILEENILKAGNNFCGGLMRLHVEYQENGNARRKAVLVKIPSLSADYAVLVETGIFDREIYMYNVVLPKLNSLEPAGHSYSPILYVATESKALVMEDLTESGYKMLPKRTILDLAHTKIALSTVARHHALSVILLQKQTEMDSKMKELLENFTRKQVMERYLHSMYEPFSKLISPWISDTVRQKLREYRKHFVNTAVMACATNDDGLNVICHGDFWKNNILFSYEGDGRVCGAKLIDWQLPRIGSPIVELIYFFVSSVPYSLFETHREELFRTYLDAVNATWSKLKFDCKFTRDEFDKQMAKYKRVFINILPGYMFIILGDETRLHIEGENRSIDSLMPQHISLVLEWLRYAENEKII